MGGEIAAIRLKAELRDPPSATGTPGQTLSQPDQDSLIAALGGAEYFPKGEQDDRMENAASALEDLKATLTLETHRAFRSTEIEISEVRFASGSVEVLIILKTVGTVVAELGAIMAGLRELARLVPAPVQRFVTARAQRVLGRSVEMQMQTDPAIEIRDAMLAGRVRDADADEGVTTASVPGGVQAVSRRDEVQVTTYLIVSHAVLLLAIIAATLMLVIDGL